MQQQSIGWFPVSWMGILFLVVVCTNVSTAQQANRPNIGSDLFPFQRILEKRDAAGMPSLADALAPPAQYHTSVAHTRPELAHLNRPVGPQYLREGRVLGSEGVVQRERRVLPFGTKGEKVALAFRSGDYEPPPGEKLQPALAALARQRAREDVNAQSTVYALILLNDWLDETLQTWLEAQGVQLLGFYPHNAYQARIPVGALQTVASHPQVRWVGHPYPLQKVDPDLLLFLGDRSGERIWLYVNLFGADETARDAIASLVAQTGVYDPSLGVMTVVADAPTVHRLLDMDAVLFVEPIRPAYALHAESQGSISADLIWYYGRDGGDPFVGTKVGVMDSGLSFHWDFSNVWSNTAGYNRTTETYWWDDVHGHGTHVTGTLLGEGNATSLYRGTAQGLRATDLDGYNLLVSKVFRVDGRSEGDSVYRGLLDMAALDSRGDHTVYTRQVFNFSGGADKVDATGTDALSRKVDEMFRKSILPVIAAGNEGPGAGTISEPGVAKGALTVGAIYDDFPGYVDRVTDFSSRGPTGDWRRKPDVVAPGAWIDSCSNTDNMGYLYSWGGTSMAAPHVAGLATGVIGQFGNYNLYAWVTKAIILANAIDLGYPRDLQGLGKVDAMLCHFDVDGWWEVYYGANYLTGDMQSRQFVLPYDASLLRVVLVYPDAPAPSGATTALVNDLDLYLDGPVVTWGSFMLDTVEVIEIYDVPAGNYFIHVHTYAHRDSTDPWQKWAVAVRAVYGPRFPNITLSLSTPVAVQPFTPFDVIGTAYANSYVASGVYGSISLHPALTLAHMTFVRYAPDGMEESFSFTGRDGINQGNIPAGFQRRLIWNVAATGDAEGAFDITYTVHSVNGGTASTTNLVIVDGTPPGEWQNGPPGWVTHSYPLLGIRVRDALSGLSSSGAYYWYWTPELGIVGPLPANAYFADGSTNLESIYADYVPIVSEGAVRFRAYDRAGNYSDSEWFPVRLDPEPPGDWQDFTITGFSADRRSASCTIRVRDEYSGLNTNQCFFAYSTDGGNTWSRHRAPTTGVPGSRALETLTASAVPLNPQGNPPTKVMFAATDVAGHTSHSPVYTIPASTKQVSGTMDLQQFLGDPSGLTATFEIRLPGTTTPLETHHVTLDAQARYTLQTTLHGTYDMAAKVSHWLRRTKTQISLTGYRAVDFHSLINGDVDGDNEVTLFDFGQLVAAFGSIPGDGNWNPNADLDGDGEVTLFDFGILVSNFGAIGDE
jgi:hypothetical protein